MSEIITIEAVTDRFKNKYSAGSVKANGKWMQVSSKLNLADFQKDTQVTVETVTNEKGYTNIVGLVEEKSVEPVKTTKTKRAEKDVSELHTKTYDEAKNLKILVQGITQAVIQAPFLAGLSFTNPQEAAELVESLSERFIGFVENRTK